MNQRYEYTTTSHDSPPDPSFDWLFKEMLKAGWRLVSMVKRGKSDFVAYWEKPVAPF